jgi:hypothetical protein
MMEAKISKHGRGFLIDGSRSSNENYAVTGGICSRNIEKRRRFRQEKTELTEMDLEGHSVSSVFYCLK